MISHRVRRLGVALFIIINILSFSEKLRADPLENGRWDGQFTTPVTGGVVNSIVVDGQTVYAGGDFTSAGGVAAGRIARWDGNSWTGLNAGFSSAFDTVLAIAKTPDGIIAGGSFTVMGGVNATNVARWDGTQWSPIGSGLRRAAGGSIDALAYLDGQLFVAGHFLLLNGTSCSIAKWNGTSWISLSSDPIWIRSLVFDGTNLFVGGKFESIGGVSATNIAMWNGANWSAMGDGLSGGINGVSALAMNNEELIAGGDFALGDGSNPNYLARWNGATWQAFGTGLNGNVNAIKIHNGAVIVGGKFTQAGGLNAKFLAAWKDNSWQPVSNGLDGISVNALAISQDDKILVGGMIISGDNTLLNNIGKYDGTNWSRFGSGATYARIYDITVSDSNLYAMGIFQSIGGTKASTLASWNGANWSAIPSSDGIEKVLAAGNVLYAGGAFSTMNGVPAQNIAMWNGTNWAALGNGISGVGGYVTSLTLLGSDLVVGGNFVNGSYRHLVKWNGATWSSVGPSSSVYPNAFVQSACGIGKNLYIGGSFTSVGSTPAVHMAQWNGTNWSAMGSGITDNNGLGPVLTIAADGSNVFAGGRFTIAGGLPAGYIAQWNGSAWSNMSGGMNGQVSKIIAYRGNVYAAGLFTSAGGVAVNNIARWDGTNWFSLGSGLGGAVAPYVLALAARDYELYAGGEFITAGDKLSYNFAIWNLRPQLQTKFDGGLLTASWPTDNSVWRAQFRSTLDSGGWTDIPQTPTLTNDTFTIQTNFTGASGYFRLVQP